MQSAWSLGSKVTLSQGIVSQPFDSSVKADMAEGTYVYQQTSFLIRILFQGCLIKSIVLAASSIQTTLLLPFPTGTHTEFGFTLVCYVSFDVKESLLWSQNRKILVGRKTFQSRQAYCGLGKAFSHRTTLLSRYTVKSRALMMLACYFYVSTVVWVCRSDGLACITQNGKERCTYWR